MIHSDAEVLLIVPCDAPLIQSQQLQKLLTARASVDADVAVAFDGERFHSVFLAIHSRVQTSLENYLASGQRKVQTWLALQNTVSVDFSDTPEIFTNINTLTDLSLLETNYTNHLRNNNSS